MSYEYYDERDSRRSGPLDPLRDAAGAAVGSLRYAKDHAFDAVSHTAHDVGRRVQQAGYATSGFVSTHAIPLTLLGVGVGLLVSSINRQRTGTAPRYLSSRYETDYGQPRRANFDAEYGSTESSYSERAAGVADAARERAGALADRAAHGLAGARDQVRGTVEAARHRLDGTLSTIGEQASNVKQHALELGHDLRDQASELGHRANQLGHQAYDQLQRTQERTRELVDENPLMVGALAIAAGVGVGLLLPATRSENQLIGQTRDRLFDEAQRTASRFGETLQRAGGDLKEALQDAASPS